MTQDEKYNEYLYKMSTQLRRGLSEVQKKARDLYKIEELEDYIDSPDSPIEHVFAALIPLSVQAGDLHDYAEAVTGRMELNLDEVDVHAMLEGVLTIADQMAEDKAVRLEDDIEENLPSLEADAERLSQALLHYIHNAVKFTDSGGTVTLRVRREPQNILFEVSDTGIGIPEEKQELVFESFETILDDKDDPRLGFGIGLKIVEHVIDLHDGETWFESAEDRGSSFFFTIPY
ncbi:MAG TPA: ATP-binding protein [Anaerolineales bacterium]|nr:ATP-binding protein [Anaerolineales bacterium]